MSTHSVIVLKVEFLSRACDLGGGSTLLDLVRPVSIDSVETGTNGTIVGLGLLSVKCTTLGSDIQVIHNHHV